MIQSLHRAFVKKFSKIKMACDDQRHIFLWQLDDKGEEGLVIKTNIENLKYFPKYHLQVSPRPRHPFKVNVRGEEPRWRNRMGRPLSLLQIHRKNN